ncbi:hypothetical protein PJI16_16865 [Nitrospira sp. MA-1]|nr:hypothetical protein [Nitrospira sp. MA-1]
MRTGGAVDREDTVTSGHWVFRANPFIARGYPAWYDPPSTQ